MREERITAFSALLPNSTYNRGSLRHEVVIDAWSDWLPQQSSLPFGFFFLHQFCKPLVSQCLLARYPLSRIDFEAPCHKVQEKPLIVGKQRLNAHCPQTFIYFFIPKNHLREGELAFCDSAEARLATSFYFILVIEKLKALSALVDHQLGEDAAEKGMEFD